MTTPTPISLPVQEIEDLWFGGLDFGFNKPVPKETTIRWFRSNSSFDTSCSKYKPLVEKLVKLNFHQLVELGSTPSESLTLLLLLDQLSRNFSRGSPFPFTKCDPLSVRLAEHFVLSLHHDTQQPPWKRQWYYLPFMHSETIPYQELGIARFAETCWEIREGEYSEFHDMFKESLAFSWKHYEVIGRFGRFPKRNEVLGRESTEDEKKYLEEGGFL